MRNILREDVLAIIFYILILYGYFANIYKLMQCDFDTPMRAEAYRITGVILFPLGIVQGYLEIKDAKR